MEAANQFRAAISIPESTVDELCNLKMDTFLFILSWKCRFCTQHQQSINRLCMYSFLHPEQKLPEIKWILGNSSSNFGSGELLSKTLNLLPKSFPAIYLYKAETREFVQVPQDIMSKCHSQGKVCISPLIDWLEL